MVQGRPEAGTAPAWEQGRALCVQQAVPKLPLHEGEPPGKDKTPLLTHANITQHKRLCHFPGM